jgi:hypothetical protein
MKPTTYPRRLRPDRNAPPGIYRGTILSGSRNDGTRWQPEIDSRTGRATCNCPAGRWGKPCHHVARLRQSLKRERTTLLADLRPCGECGQANAQFELADDAGNPVPGAWVCRECVERQAGVG